MKKILFALFLTLAIVGCKEREVNYVVKDYDITAGHGFIEVDGKAAREGITIPFQKTISEDSRQLGVTEKLTNWTNPDAHAVYFFHTPKGMANLKMNVTYAQGQKAKFRIRVFDTDNPGKKIKERTVEFEGTGENQVVEMIKCDFKKAGYNKYDLEILSDNTQLQSINKWQFDLEEQAEPYSPWRLMSPSVHLLNYSSTDPEAPEGEAYDWAYEEVMIPRGESPVKCTYVMSLGVLAGYMGIQVLDTDDERTVLFSQWDDGDTDIDPNLPDHLRSTAVDTGEGIKAGRFGAEGTGVQSYKKGGAFWEYDKYVQFITHCRNDISEYQTVENGRKVTKQMRNMIVSAWWNAQDGKGWQYISTLRVANRNSFIKSWYSFVEDFVDFNGQELRTGYFRNAYARSRGENAKWYHQNKVRFGHNDGEDHIGARKDYWQDIDPNDPTAWKMTTGGFANQAHEGNSELVLRTDHTPVDTINLDALLAREELALEKERKRLEAE